MALSNRNIAKIYFISIVSIIYTIVMMIHLITIQLVQYYMNSLYFPFGRHEKLIHV